MEQPSKKRKGFVATASPEVLDLRPVKADELDDTTRRTDSNNNNCPFEVAIQFEAQADLIDAFNNTKTLPNRLHPISVFNGDDLPGAFDVADRVILTIWNPTLLEPTGDNYRRAIAACVRWNRQKDSSVPPPRHLYPLSLDHRLHLQLDIQATTAPRRQHMSLQNILPTVNSIKTTLGMAPSLPKSYKVAMFKAKGEPLSIEEVELQQPAAGEILIKVEACGVCHSDSAVKDGLMGNKFPIIPGHEVIGHVVAVGDGEKGQWKVGDRVGGAWHGGHDGTCTSCKRGMFQMCVNETVNGVYRNGGYGEYANLRVEATVKIPDHADAATYAPLLCAGVTVFNSMRRLQVQPGSLVAIQGLGGLGHLAVQYAHKMGFKVVALSSGGAKEKFAKDLGADEYLDASKGNLAEGLQKLGGAAMIVCTAPNPQVIGGLINGLGAQGKLLILAPVGDVPINTVPMIMKGLSVHGFPSGHSLDSEEAIEFAELHDVKCMVEKFPLRDATKAFDRMMSGDDPRRPHNGDGFGVGYYTTHPSLGPSPCLFTSTTPAWNCINLSRLASKTTSPLIFAHVRATTSGALSSTNCHPFRHNSLMWMHNGNIACWNLVKRELAVGLGERWFLGVLGGTDSEWAFAIFLDEMERGGCDPSSDPVKGGFGHVVLRKAMLKTVARINALVKAIPKERLERAEEVETRSLLNFAVTDGHSVVCTRYVSSRTDDAASLYWSSGTSWREVDVVSGQGKENDATSIKSKKSSAGWSESEEREEKRFVMERRDRGADIVLVASEPLTFERDNWVTVPTNSILTIHKQTVMIHPILDEYSTPSPSFSRTSKFAKSKGLVSTAPGRVESVTPAGEMSGEEAGGTVLGQGNKVNGFLKVEAAANRAEVERVRERLEELKAVDV
ncbi:hypothetical protein MMC30_008077 [Trapelia coarctata]|nr:hypothetical protein [Trapelia coarctata]